MKDPRNSSLLWLEVLSELYSVHERSSISSKRLLAELAWAEVPPSRREPYWQLYYALKRDQEVPPRLLAVLKRGVTFDCHPALEVLQLVADGSLPSAALLLADSSSVESLVERMVAHLAGCTPSCPSRSFLSEHLGGVLDFEDVDGLYDSAPLRRALFAAAWALCWAHTHEPGVLSRPEYRSFLRHSITRGPSFRALRDAAQWTLSGQLSPAELDVFYGLLLDGVEALEAQRLARVVLA